MRGGEHDVERQRGRAAGLEQQQPPQLVALGLEVAHLLEHRRPGDVEHAADHDPARLALGVGIDAMEDAAAHAPTAIPNRTFVLPSQQVSRNDAFPPLDMRIGRELLTGMGWAGMLGVVALCTLMFLFTYVAFDGDRHERPRDDGAVELPSVPEAEGRAVPLGRPPPASPLPTA